MEENEGADPQESKQEPRDESKETIPLSERRKGVDFIDPSPAPVDKYRPSLDDPDAPAASSNDGGEGETDSSDPAE